MNKAILKWSPNPFTNFPLSSFHFTLKHKPITLLTLNLTNQKQEQEKQELGAKERRKLKNERRLSNVSNWKEEVEMKLIKKPKKRYSKWTEELNLDTLAELGPQWWTIRVSRINSQFTVDRLALSLANNYPHFQFKMYNPTVQVKNKLKNGSISVKAKPIFPGCVFLRCVLNKEMHDFIRDFDGIGGFLGSKVGNKIRQINKPRPVAEEDIEKIFQQAKEEQEKADLAFQEKLKSELESAVPNLDTPLDTNSKGQIEKVTAPARRGRKSKYPKIGSTVKVVSGSFSEFSGIVKKLDKKNEKVTVGFTIFGKETISDLDLQQITSEE